MELRACTRSIVAKRKWAIVKKLKITEDEVYNYFLTTYNLMLSSAMIATTVACVICPVLAALILSFSIVINVMGFVVRSDWDASEEDLKSEFYKRDKLLYLEIPYRFFLTWQGLCIGLLAVVEALT